MIDLHHHCLPGVDDGPETLEEAVAQCREAYADGIRTILATPHRLHPQYDVPPEAARAAHAALRDALAREGVALDLRLGSEIHYATGIAAGLRDGALLGMGEARRWFLFELPAAFVPLHLESMIFEMHLAGAYPVLAHPERNHELAGDTGRLRRIRDQGVPMQITAMSLTGGFGRQPRKAAERWLKEGLVDLLATDAHDTGKRPPRLAEAVDRAAGILGRAEAERLVLGNPARILAGEALS
ncbi:MAG: hypothetical protein L6R43_18015 [Planctomycetes bacterium]|nr:hypothetical protein [Planctomycetota bacterium]